MPRDQVTPTLGLFALDTGYPNKEWTFTGTSTVIEIQVKIQFLLL